MSGVCSDEGPKFENEVCVRGSGRIDRLARGMKTAAVRHDYDMYWSTVVIRINEDDQGKH